MSIDVDRPIEAPDDWNTLSTLEKLSLLPIKVRDQYLLQMIEQGIDLAHPPMEIELRPKQLDIINCSEWVLLMSMGRGYGKTLTGACWINSKAKEHPGCEISLIGRTVADVRDVMVQGPSGILAKSDPGFTPTYTSSTRKIEWPNGSTALTYSADNADQLRGPQSHFSWCDELAAYNPKPDASGATMWDNVLMSTRLGERPQILITTTPKRTPVVKNLIKESENTKESGVKLFTGSTMENRANLSAIYIRAIHNKYAGTHLEQQELHGELFGDAEGALWRTQDFHFADTPDNTDVITVIGVDPSVGKGGGDACGIVVASAENLGWAEINKRKAWVMEDLTAQMAPDEWTRVIVDAHRRYPGSIVAIESNQGFELLRFVIHQIDPSIPIALVHSKMNKAQRAEPVVMAFRQGRVFLTDPLQDLVDECVTWEPATSKWSPGRIDALSVALGTLLVDPRPLYPYMPAAQYIPNDDEVKKLNVVPSWRQYHQTHSGLALPPWRR